jgi:raffinose/stachyose/melibiose transport system permease protein
VTTPATEAAPRTRPPALDRRPDRPRPRRKRPRGIGVTLALAIIAVFWFGPLLLLFLTALRPQADFLGSGALSLPEALTLENFARAWGIGRFPDAFTNSILLVAIKVPLGVFISALLAYALAKLRIRFRRVIMWGVFLGLTIPIYITIVPLFAMLRSVGLTDDLWGLLGPYLAFGIPFETLVLQSFLRRVPGEITEAAHVDGAGPWRVFFRIMLPLSVPALVTVAILDAVATWNELLMALIILSSEENKTIPVGLLNFQGQFSTDHTGLAAGIVIAVLPILVGYALLQRYIVSGLTAGAVKG